MKEQDAVSQHPMPQQSRCVVENDEVDEGARDLAAQPRGKVSDRASAVVTSAFLIDEHGNVEIALLSRTARGAAPEEKSKTNLRHFRQGSGESICSWVQIVGHETKVTHTREGRNVSRTFRRSGTAPMKDSWFRAPLRASRDPGAAFGGAPPASGVRRGRPGYVSFDQALNSTGPVP